MPVGTRSRLVGQVATTFLLLGLLLLGGEACSSPRSQPAPPSRASPPDPGAIATADATVPALCFDCHGDPANGNPAPPRSVKGARDPVDVAVGAHQAHVRGGLLRAGLACAECHATPDAANPFAHIDGQVATLTWGALSGSRGVAASSTTSTAGGGAPARTCTNYCHAPSPAAGGTNHAPSWTAVDGTQASCGTCHGIPPPAPHPPVAAGVTGCAGCHPGTVSAGGIVDVAGGKHVNGVVDVGTGSPGAALGCTSCHGEADRTPAAIAPAPPAGTHGETLTSTRAVGAHQRHLVDGTIRTAIACTECHVVPTSTNGHPSGTVDLSFGTLARTGSTAPAWNGTTCSGTYCHGASLGAGGTATAPSWTTVDGSQRQCTSCHGAPPPASSGHPAVDSALTGCAGCHPSTVKADGTIDVAGGKHVNGTVEASSTCTSCHGDPNRSPAAIAAAPPRDTQGNATSNAVGAHLAHLTGGSIRSAVACGDCHAVPSDGGHASQALDLTWGALARTGSVTPSWSAASLTCTNYCHGVTLFGGSNTAPAWNGGSAQATCGTCHGLPPTRAVGASQHPAVSGNAAECATCHPATVTSAGAIDTGGGKHVNGSVDLDYARMTCTTCHGDGSRAAVAGADANVKAAPPAGTHGETLVSTRAAGAHQAHLNRGTFAAPVACAECHVVPGSNAHADGAVVVTFGILARAGRAGATLPSWNGTTCSNTSCHAVITASGASAGGSNRAPSWTAGTMSCTACHATTTLTTGEHQKHIVSEGVACSVCHGPAFTTSTVDPTLHVNGTRDVAPGAWPSGPGWNPTTRSCTNGSGCHGGTKGPW